MVLLSIKTEYEENLKKYTYCKNNKKNNMKIIEEVKIEERIRDIIYMKNKDAFILMLENSPLLGIFKIIH